MNSCQKCAKEIEKSKDWAWLCTKCYLDDTKKIDRFLCLRCDRPFYREINQKWKKQCFDCYKKSKDKVNESVQKKSNIV